MIAFKSATTFTVSGIRHVQRNVQRYASAVLTSPSPSIIWKYSEKKEGTTKEVVCRLLCEHQFESSLFPLETVTVSGNVNASKIAPEIEQGKAILYVGDYYKAKNLYTGLKRFFGRTKKDDLSDPVDVPVSELWEIQRNHAIRLSRYLNRLLVVVGPDHRLESVPRRAPQVPQEILSSHFGPQTEPYAIPLREILGMIGAYEWKKNGVFIPQIDDYIHAEYGVFSPTRREYLDLLMALPIPTSTDNTTTMMDVGTGTGIISAVMMLKRNVTKSIGTDINPRAVKCAQDNLSKLGLSDRAEVIQADTFPSRETVVDLIVCNPPWLPGKAFSSLDLGIYDENLSMLRRFLTEARYHLRSETSEVWLILSTMAELLKLRSREALLQMIDEGGLKVEEVIDTKPDHAKAKGEKPTGELAPIVRARADETTLLFRLRVK